MDFTKKDARAAAEVAQFCQLKDQDTGVPLVDEKTGEAVGVMVLGASSRKIHAQLKEDQRAKLKGAKIEDEARVLEDVQADLVESAARLTAGFQNVQRGEKDATLDDAKWFYDLNMFSTSALLQPDPKKWQNLSFAQQVLAFSNDNANFLGNG